MVKLTQKLTCKQTVPFTDIRLEEITYCYTLDKLNEENEMYKISVCKENKRKITDQYNKIIKCDSEIANYVIQLLHNNCVAPIHLCDILEDIGV